MTDPSSRSKSRSPTVEDASSDTSARSRWLCAALACLCLVGGCAEQTTPTFMPSRSCAENNGGCDPLVDCTDHTDSEPTCGACPSGYTGDGSIACIDVDECASTNGGCDPLTLCTNVPGSRTCGACPIGFVGTGESGCVACTMCGAACVATSVDAAHCGACDHACGLGGVCDGGACETSAGDACEDFNGTCTDVSTCASYGLACTGGYALWPMPDTTGYSRAYTLGVNTVVDAVTRLEWQREVPAMTYNWPGADTYCYGLTLDGKSDWRLPSRRELDSIVDYDVANPSIDQVAFPGTPADAYWASSPYIGLNGNHWYVFFTDGSAYFGNNTTLFAHVRCVRGG